MLACGEDERRTWEQRTVALINRMRRRSHSLCLGTVIILVVFVSLPSLCPPPFNFNRRKTNDFTPAGLDFQQDKNFGFVSVCMSGKIEGGGAKGRERNTDDKNNYRSQAQRMGSSYHPIDKSYRSLFSCAPLILSTREHNKQGLLLVLLRRIPVRCARAHLSFSLRESMTNGILFLSSREEFPLIVLTFLGRTEMKP